jgi:GTP pyrophosphokinase
MVATPASLRSDRSQSPGGDGADPARASGADPDPALPSGVAPAHPSGLDAAALSGDVDPGATRPLQAVPADALHRALALVEAQVADTVGGSGEPILGHARGTVAILAELNVDEPTQVAAALFGLGERLSPSAIEEAFGTEAATLVGGMRQLLRLKDLTLQAKATTTGGERETLRRMMLAMATDIRVVLIRLASRLQTLRWHVESRTAPPAVIANETLEILAPLANRLGLGQLKWEMEDLAFRFLEPELYKSIARQLEERRVEREEFVQSAVARLRAAFEEHAIRAEVTGRPKHIHSIYNKMRTKGLTFAEVQDLRAFRVIVADVKDCYTVLGMVHQMWPPIPREFDDYISRPKPNGYQSLHTVVVGEDGRALEIQIRTRAMHRHAEFGVASHWRYKEASTGLAGAAGGAADADRIGWVRQLLAWQQELGESLGARMPAPARSDDEDGGEDGERIYVLTPQARVVELPAGSTAIDFAYHVHTQLGHRCRGARVDGQMVSLHTALRTGQTVEIIAARAGSEGPSRDWLNPQLGYVRSQRARAKVRQWFNAIEIERDVAAGREKVERVLQREGKTALAFDELSRRLGFERPEDLFVAVAKDETGPRALEEAVRGQLPGATGAASAEAQAPLVPRPARVRRSAAGEGVLVVGVDFLMTQLARCCRPAPPDPIVGFVTRGRGVSVHRVNCRSFAEMARKAPERVLETDWGDWQAEEKAPRHDAHSYPVDVTVRARDRQGLLRDISDVFARDRLNVTAVQTLSREGVAQMQFTVEVPNIPKLDRTLGAIRDVGGVMECRRR